MAMEIKEEINITIKDLVDGYTNNPDTGEVTTMGGRLNVRPAYQREFVWDNGNSDGKKQKALIDSIMNGYPINVMYWIELKKEDENGPAMFECLDGQQRIITMCKFKNNEFSMADGTQFNGLADNKKFLDYKAFTIYICTAETLEEKLSWFERINTGGEPLSNQEMRSAIACGPGTTLAKKFFVNTIEQSGKNANSFGIQNGKAAKEYITGSWNRQDIYEKVIMWHEKTKKDDAILAYMKNNRNNIDAAEELFEYFQNVINWVKTLFTVYDTDMKKVEWGFLYNKYHENKTLSQKKLEEKVKLLRADVGKNDNNHLEKTTGIYEYVLAIANGEDKKEAERLLSRRTFSLADKKAQYEHQHHICPHCFKRFEDISMMAGDHIIPYSPIPSSGQENGKTTPDNLQMLCHSCNSDKSNNPFDPLKEKETLKKIYAMTEDAVKEIPECMKNKTI